MTSRHGATDPPDPVQGAPALVVPGSVEEATGGNVWDRRVRDALAATTGAPVPWLPVPGSWPDAGPEGEAALDVVLGSRPDGSAALVDGLVAAGAPAVVERHARRLRLGVVLHLPLSLETGLDPAVAAARDADERRALAAVDVVVTTSRWTADRLDGHDLRRAPVVASPGTDPAAVLAPATTTGTHLLCLGSVRPRKGQRVLLDALAGLDASATAATDVGWTLRVVGPVADPAEAAAVRAVVDAEGLASRVALLPAATGAALEEHWRWADLLVVPSSVETFGMVVTEALARGRPALVTTGSGLPEALGTTPAGPPGLHVPPGETAALREGLQTWLTDRDLRDDLRARARVRAAELHGWDATATAVLGAFR